MNKTVKKYRNGIFHSASRNCGETYMEPIIRMLFGWVKSLTKDNDAITTDGKRAEIKTSKVLMKKKKVPSFTETVMSEGDNNGPGLINRLIKFMDCYDTIYDSNIQNIKKHKFDILIYVMLFEDCIKIFKSTTEGISNIPGWSGKHGGEDRPGKNGQFNIKKHKIKWHLDNNLIQTLTWEEVYEMSTDIIRSKGKKNHWVYKGEEKDSE